MYIAPWIPPIGYSIRTPPSAGRGCAILSLRRPRSSRRSAREWPPRAGVPDCWRCRAKTVSGREARASQRGASSSPTNQGQPWTATLPTLQLLRDFGFDPCSGRVRWAVARVRDRCHREHAGQPFFSGEVEPCINGRTVTLGTYFADPLALRRAACPRILPLGRDSPDSRRDEAIDLLRCKQQPS